ncbi:MAG: O-acetyl-ADP-ribose deacetylase [Endomicrobiales bacterium]|nr:O-acetyl-ADP-ribose deacetylase [Endomicrobiales bacterium]
MDFSVGSTKISFLRGDITDQDTEAIVNAANSSLMGGGGVDGAIHRAGGPEIIEECKRIISEIGRLETGKAVITSGGNLKARYVIHAVGPVWRGGRSKEDELLRSAYASSLDVAGRNGVKSLSFPSISTGAYGFPIDAASAIAVKSVFKTAEKSAFSEIRFVLFSDPDLDAYVAAAAAFKKTIVK